MSAPPTLAGVSGLVAAIGNGQVTLSWTNPADNEFDHIEIIWTSPDNDGIEILSAAESGNAGASASAVITGLTNNTTYTFTVVAVGISGNISQAQTTTATPNIPDSTPPSAVSALMVDPDDMQVTLSWSNPADNDFDHIEIMWTPAGNSGMKTLSMAESGAVGANVSTIIDGLTNNTAYMFTVVAVDTSGNNSQAQTATATPIPDTTPPAAVSAVSAQPVMGHIVLNWTNPSDSDVSAIRISWTPNDATVNLPPSTMSYAVPDLAINTAYTFTIQAIDSSGNSSPVVTVMATTNIFYTIALETAFDFTLPAESEAQFMLTEAVDSASGYYIDAPDNFGVTVNDTALDGSTLFYGGVSTHLPDTWMALPLEDGTLFIDVTNDSSNSLSGTVRVRKSPHYLPFGEYSGDELGHGPLLVLPPAHTLYVTLVQQGDWTTTGIFLDLVDGTSETFVNMDLIGEKSGALITNSSTTTPRLVAMLVSDGGLNFALLASTPISLGTMRFLLSSAP